jgi:uncharacterized membrane protein HdeD (DUF308 family)
MPTALAQNWWTVLVRGIVSILFGIVAFAWPGATGLALILLFAGYAFVDGLAALTAAILSFGKSNRGWLFLAEGLVSLVVAIIALCDPFITAAAISMLIAIWVIISGILKIAAALQLRKQIAKEWLLLLAGAFSIIIGVLLTIQPVVGIFTIIYMTGFYAVIIGVAQIGLSLRLRDVNQATTAAGKRFSAVRHRE